MGFDTVRYIYLLIWEYAIICLFAFPYTSTGSYRCSLSNKTYVKHLIDNRVSEQMCAK